MRHGGGGAGAGSRGRAGAGLLAHILVSKYDDHLPLYRQAEIFAREGVGLETSTLSGWVGATAAALKPLVDALAAEIMASDTLHVDDTPVPVLAPGTGKTKTGRLWVYVRDERPFAGARPPAALFRYSADRKGEHPRTHLKAFTGVIHADGGACPRAGRRPGPWAGFNELFAGNRITEAACWAHPWTAPRVQGNSTLVAIAVVCSHPFGLASRRSEAAGPDDIRSSVPYHVYGLRVRCAQRVGRSSVRPDLPSTTVLPSHSPHETVSAYVASAVR